MGSDKVSSKYDGGRCASLCASGNVACLHDSKSGMLRMARRPNGENDDAEEEEVPKACSKRGESLGAASVGDCRRSL